MCRRHLSILIILLTCGAPAEAAIVWPDDADWEDIVTTAGGVYDDSDTKNVSPTSGDLVGGVDSNGNTYAAARWAFDNTNLFFSLRMEDLSGQLSGIWQVLIDKDSDGDLDFVLELDVGGGDDPVQLRDVTTAGPTFEDVVLGDTPLWEDTTDDYWRLRDPTGDGSAFEGDSDIFIEMAIPYSRFYEYTGIDKGDPFAFAFSTSTTDQHINKDVPLGLSISDNVADAFSGDITAVPEPGTILLTGIGLLSLLALRRRRRRTAPLS